MHPGGRPLDQGVPNFATQSVIVNHVELEQDVVPGFGDAREQAFEGVRAVHQQFDVIALEHHEVRQLFDGVAPGRPFRLGNTEDIEPVLETLEGLLRFVLNGLEEFRPTGELVAAEHEVGRQGQEGKAHQGHGPGHGALRGPCRQGRMGRGDDSPQIKQKDDRRDHGPPCLLRPTASDACTLPDGARRRRPGDVSGLPRTPCSCPGKT